LKADLEENQKLIDRVYIHFVFKGDGMPPRIARASGTSRKLASKKWIIKEHFEAVRSM